MSGSGKRRAARPADRRGVALVVTVFALVVIGALVSGIFFAGRLEQQSGENTLFLSQAAAAAEAGLNSGLVSISPAALSALTPGASLDLGPIALEPGLTVERQVARLTGNLFLLRAQATRRNAAGGALASRAAGLLVQLRSDSTAGASVLAPISQRAWVQLY